MSGQPEIQDFDPRSGRRRVLRIEQKDVARFDVAMDDALFVGVGEGPLRPP